MLSDQVTEGANRVITQSGSEAEMVVLAGQPPLRASKQRYYQGEFQRNLVRS